MSTLMQFPTGRWGFVGRVPAVLAWARKDSTPMTDTDWHTVTYCMMPGSFGYRQPTWATESEANAALDAINTEKSDD